MSVFEIYQRTFNPNTSSRNDIPVPDWSKLREPDGYLPEQSLVDAVNVALALGQPLLITGEAGTGKTLLAYSIAHQLGLGRPLKFETKSTSESKDLFYTYNALARFQAAQAGEAGTTLDYIDFNALGKAILRANPANRYTDLRGRDDGDATCSRSVVLIDEIDKAPRDFPNDILNEVEHLSFRVPELGNRVISASEAFRPIVVLTSNSEKNLPDAFLRRCIFYHISFPQRAALEEIVKTRMSGLGVESAFLATALDLFEFLRSAEASLVKKPATAELLGWLIALRRRFPDDSNPLNRPIEETGQTICAILKTIEDQKQAPRLLERWKSKPADTIDSSAKK